MGPPGKDGIMVSMFVVCYVSRFGICLVGNIVPQCVADFNPFTAKESVAQETLKSKSDFSVRLGR